MRIPKLASVLVVLLAAVLGVQAQTVKKTILYPNAGVTGVAVDSNHGRAYVLLANFNSTSVNVVQVFSSEDGHLLATYSVPVTSAIAVNSATGNVYVGGVIPDLDANGNNILDANGNALSILEVVVLNGKTGAILATIPVNKASGAGIVALAVDTTTNSVFAADQSDNVIAAINGKTNTLTSVVPVTGAPTSLAAGSGKVYATVANVDPNTNANFAQLATITEKTGAVTYVDYGSFAAGVAVDSQLKRAYPVDGNFPGAVAAISGSSILASIAVGLGPLGIAVDGVTGDIFVANSGDGTVSKISAGSDAVINTVTPPSGDAQLVAIDTDEGVVWVAGSNSVTLMREN